MKRHTTLHPVRAELVEALVPCAMPFDRLRANGDMRADLIEMFGATA
jgi:hypothetical protein